MGVSRELIYSRSRSALKLGRGRFQRNTESLRNICNIGLVVAATCVLLVAVLLGMAGLNA